VLAEQPEVAIGARKGETPYQLSGVSDATRQAEGTIVVADCQSGELRFFDIAGRSLRSVGRRGKGPGEFAFLRRILPLGGDTLAAHDGIRVRITPVAGELPGRVLPPLDTEPPASARCGAWASR
jgi:hypothetical protein